MYFRATGLGIGLASDLTARLVVEILLYVSSIRSDRWWNVPFSRLGADRSNITALRVGWRSLSDLLLAATITWNVTLRLAGFVERSSFDATCHQQWTHEWSISHSLSLSHDRCQYSRVSSSLSLEHHGHIFGPSRFTCSESADDVQIFGARWRRTDIEIPSWSRASEWTDQPVLLRQCEWYSWSISSGTSHW